MKSYIKEVVAVMLFCGMSVIGEEATEQTSNDFSIRVSLGNAPGVEKLSGTGVSVNGDTKFNDGIRLEVLAVKRFWSEEESRAGGTFGGGLFVSRQDGRENGGTGTTEISAFGGMIQGGLAIKASESLIFELTPYFGLGGSQNRVKGVSIENGPYYFYGIKGGFFFELSSNIELGLELGYEGFQQEVEYQNIAITSSGSGFRGAFVLAVKF